MKKVRSKFEKEESKEEELSSCNDAKCPFHGDLATRGRSFEGHVTKKFSKRIVVEFERVTYVRKYERYAKKRTKLHVRLPECMADKIKVGDYVKVVECRPLSKLIHFVVVERVR